MSDHELVDMRSYRMLDEADGEELIELAPAEDERDFLEKIVRSVRQPMQRRVRAAIELLPLKYPKQSAVNNTHRLGRDFASLLERALLRSDGVRQVKQIEAQAVQVNDDAQVNDDEQQAQVDDSEQ